MPSPFQARQPIAKRADGAKYITKDDVSTVSWVDFGCKKVMLLYAVVAAVAAVVAALCVATGGAALLVIGAVAGASGAALGAVVGTMICGQLVAPTRIWLTCKNDFKIQGIETITGGSHITCTAFTYLGMSPETITFNPQIKSWSDAIKMGAASFAANVLQGAMTGLMIGGAAVALPAMIEGGAVAFAEGGTLNVFKFLGSNVLKNYAASWLTGSGLALRGSMVAESTLEGYGQRGEVRAGDMGRGAFGMELGTAQSVQNIAHGSMNPLDYIGLALWMTPAGEMMKGKEESQSGERGNQRENVENTNRNDQLINKGNERKGNAYETGLGKFEGDPARDYYGSGNDSHPVEWNAIIDQLKVEGVKVEYRDGTLAYEPGNPGRIILDPNASYSALSHEFQHFLDNKANGGSTIGYYIENPQARIDMEVKAYDVEIRMAEENGNPDLANQLEILKQNEVNYIKKYYVGGE